MTKNELQTRLSACRATAEIDPQAALRSMARLNVTLDFALGRITAPERDILLSDTNRAMVRFEQQTAAFSRGELIL